MATDGLGDLKSRNEVLALGHELLLESLTLHVLVRQSLKSQSQVSISRKKLLLQGFNQHELLIRVFGATLSLDFDL